MIARGFLFAVLGAVVLSAVAVGLIVAGATSNSPLSQRIPGATFLGCVWAGLHSGYIMAPFCYRRPRRKLALVMMALPALACVGGSIVAVVSGIRDVSVTHNKEVMMWISAYVACGMILYVGAPVLMLVGTGRRGETE